VPAVTCVITTFNRERYLPAAIQSVLAQTATDFELLVLDNASTDGTERLVASFGDPRIRYLKHPPCTIGRQRNLGVRQARADFIAFLDDDDEWLPTKLERQLAAFRAADPDVALVYGGFVRVDADGLEFEVHPPVLRGHVLSDLLWHADAFTGSASNPMLRLSAVRALGGYKDALATSEDWELYVRLAERHRVESVPDVVVRIRSHRGPRLGDRVDEALRAEEIVLVEHQAAMDSRLRSFYLQTIGGKLTRLGHGGAGRIKIKEAIRLDPTNVRAYVQYALSLCGSRVYRQAHGLYRRRFR
jgi:O-antigen biosynthesis protein